MKRSASRNGNQRYDVHLSGAVAKRVRQLMRRALREGRGVAMPENEVRTPVDVITVGRALLELAAGPHQGIFHLAGCSRVSRSPP